MVIGPHPSCVRFRRGLTLLECTLALVIVPMAVAAVTIAVVAGQSQATEAMRQTRAAMLAEALMEEILTLSYNPTVDAALGSEGGETQRNLYNSPNDFHGFAESAGNLLDAAGVRYPDAMQRFARSVSCQTESVTVHFAGGGTFTKAGLRVTVTVTQNTVPVAVIIRFLPEEDG